MVSSTARSANGRFGGTADRHVVLVERSKPTRCGPLRDTLTPTLSRKRERGKVLPLPLAGEGWGEGPQLAASGPWRTTAAELCEYPQRSVKSRPSRSLGPSTVFRMKLLGPARPARQSL